MKGPQGEGSKYTTRWPHQNKLESQSIFCIWSNSSRENILAFSIFSPELDDNNFSVASIITAYWNILSHGAQGSPYLKPIWSKGCGKNIITLNNEMLGLIPITYF